MQQLCFTTAALTPVLGTPGDENAHPPHMERLSMSRAEVAELEDVENDVRGVLFPSRTRCLNESLLIVCVEEKAPAPKLKEKAAKMRKLPSSIISTGNRRKNGGTRWKLQRRQGLGS